MNIEYNGTIAVPVDDAWAVLSDLERVAACLPGVRLDQAKGDEVAGTVTVPLGPLRLTYRGEAAFVERDAEARRVVIDAAGRDSHGEQAASARVTVQLREDGSGTHVAALADVSVRGMSAPVGFAVREFGTGLLREFVSRIGAARRTAEADTAARRGPEPETAARGGAEPDTVARRGPEGETAARAGAAEAERGAEPEPAAASALVMEEPGRPRVPEPRPGPSPRLHVAHGVEDAVYPVPPPGEGTTLPAAVQYVPYAGALAVGVLIGWLAGRRRR